MTASIRAYIRRRSRRAIGVGLLLWLLLAVLPFLVVPGFAASRFALPCILVGAACLTGSVLYTRHVRCPSCRRQIGRAVGLLIAFGPSRVQPTECPYCHASLEQPMP